MRKLYTDSRRLFWTLQSAGWLAYAALHFLSALAHGKPLGYYKISLTLAAAGFGLTLLLRGVFKSSWDWRPLPRVALCIASLLVASVIFGLVYANVLMTFCDECRPRNLVGYLGYVGSVVYVMLSWSALYFSIRYLRALQAQSENLLVAQTTAHQAQLKMLRYQLNPHFLFNTLNAISTLILDHDTDTANQMVTRLSAFLRYSLDSDPMQRVTLKQELEALSLYLSIEKVRFADRLKMHFDTQDESLRALVPSLILQPLIENTIKHAIAKREQGGSIWISTARSGNELFVEIKDDGPGSPCFEVGGPEPKGVGLANTRDRLRVLYGERHTLTIRNLHPAGTEVRIRIPFESASA